MSRDDVYQRLEDSIKSPYDTEGEMWSALLSTVADEVVQLENVDDEIKQSTFVSDATGVQLEMIGDLVEVDRRHGESDDLYRRRIQTSLRSKSTSATVSDIKDAVSILFDAVDSDEVEIQEPYNLEPMHINVGFPFDELDSAEITDPEFVGILKDVVAVGVSIGLLLTELHIDGVVMSDVEQTSPESSVDDTLNIKDIADLGENISTESIILQDGVEFDRGVSEELLAMSDGSSILTPLGEQELLHILDESSAVQDDTVESFSSGEGRWNVDAFQMVNVETEEKFVFAMAMSDTGEVQNAILLDHGMTLGDSSSVAGDDVGSFDSHNGRWNVDSFNVPLTTGSENISASVYIDSRSDVQPDTVGSFTSSEGRWGVDAFQVPRTEHLESLIECVTVGDSLGTEVESVDSFTSDDGRWSVDAFQEPLTSSDEYKRAVVVTSDISEIQTDVVGVFGSNEGRWGIDSLPPEKKKYQEGEDKVVLSGRLNVVRDEVTSMHWGNGLWNVDYNS